MCVMSKPVIFESDNIPYDFIRIVFQDPFKEDIDEVTFVRKGMIDKSCNGKIDVIKLKRVGIDISDGYIVINMIDSDDRSYIYIHPMRTIITVQMVNGKKVSCNMEKTSKEAGVYV